MAIKGSCLCGAVGYEVTGSFAFAGHCHCSMCRKAHGAAFATWAAIEPEQFRWTSGSELLQGYVSSPGNERFFCRQCGSPLAMAQNGKVSEVTLATIDGDPGVQPREHIFVGSKTAWFEINDELAQYEEWPPGS